MNKVEKIKLLLQIIRQTSDSARLLGNFHDDIAKNAGQEIADRVQKKLAERFEEFRKEDLEARIRVYDRHLSEAAIDSAIAFYTGDGGREFADKVDVLGNELGKASQEFVKNVMNELFTELRESEGITEFMGESFMITDMDPDEEEEEDEDEDGGDTTLDDLMKKYG